MLESGVAVIVQKEACSGLSARHSERRSRFDLPNERGLDLPLRRRRWFLYRILPSICIHRHHLDQAVGSVIGGARNFYDAIWRRLPNVGQALEKGGCVEPLSAVASAAVAGLYAASRLQMLEDNTPGIRCFAIPSDFFREIGFGGSRGFCGRRLSSHAIVRLDASHAVQFRLHENSTPCSGPY